jgi:hypothetical protein
MNELISYLEVLLLPSHLFKELIYLEVLLLTFFQPNFLSANLLFHCIYTRRTRVTGMNHNKIHSIIHLHLLIPHHPMFTLSNVKQTMVRHISIRIFGCRSLIQSSYWGWQQDVGLCVVS